MLSEMKKGKFPSYKKVITAGLKLNARNLLIEKISLAKLCEWIKKLTSSPVLITE